MPVTKSADDANYMQLAIRSRIKLFYRPKNLPGDPVAAANDLRWQLIRNGDAIVLRGTNDTAFHVSMDHASVKVADQEYQVVTEMIPPMSNKEFVVRDLKQLPAKGAELDYANVNDFGAVVNHTVQVAAQSVVQPDVQHRPPDKK